MNRKFAGINRLKGQVMVLAVVTMTLILLTTLIVFNVNQLTTEKERLQNTADNITYSVALVEARDMNFAAYTNRAMVANQVGISQLVGFVSWFRYLFRLSDNMIWLGRLMLGLSAIPGMQWLTPLAKAWNSVWKVIKKVAKQGGKVFETISKVLVPILDVMGKVLSFSQAIYHLGSVESAVQTIGEVMKLNDDSAETTVAGKVAFGLHELNWLILFTKWGVPSFAPNSLKKFFYKDPPTLPSHMTRFKDVTMDSRDGWGKHRQWGLCIVCDPPGAWGPQGTPSPPVSISLAGITIGFYIGFEKKGGSDLVLNNKIPSRRRMTKPGKDKDKNPEPEKKIECKSPDRCPNKYWSGTFTLDEYNSEGSPTGGNGYTYENCGALSNSCSGKNCTTPRRRCYNRNEAVKGRCNTYRTQQINECEQQKKELEDKQNNDSAGDAKRSPNEVKNKKEIYRYHWGGFDATGFVFKFSFDLDWKIFKINFDIKFDLPFGWGAARAGMNKWVVKSFDNGEYGLPTPQSLREDMPLGYLFSKFEWGKKKEIGKQQGLEGYLGVNNLNADHFESPGIVLEIRKPKAAIRTSDVAGIGFSGPASADAERARFFGQGGHPFDLSRQSQNYMFAASKAHAVYKRPDGTLQRGNMFNPYWQPRLVKYNKYLPPEKLILFYMRTKLKKES